MNSTILSGAPEYLSSTIDSRIFRTWTRAHDAGFDEQYETLDTLGEAMTFTISI